MRTEQARRIIIKAEESKAIHHRIRELGGQVLMNDGLLTRAIFSDARASHAREGSGKPDGKAEGWVRVRMGDVDTRGAHPTTLTYKKIEHAETGDVERVIDLVVDSFDKTLELLQKVGLRLRSRQESKRTKYLVTYHDLRYIVNLDMWPWLEHLTFVGVISLDGVPTEDLVDFCEAIGIARSGSREYVGGVDAIYEKERGFRLQNIRDVRFNLPRPTVSKRGSRGT